MKKFITIMFIALIAMFTSCGTKDTTEEIQNSETPLLSSITFNNGVTLNETISTDTLVYTSTVGLALSVLTITGIETTIDSATIEINGETFTGSKTINLNLGNNIITIILSNGDKSKTYTLNITRGFHDYIKASNTDSGDWFGISIAISGDTMVVGAKKEDSNAIGINGDKTNNDATESGAIYVFTRSGTTWIQEAYIKPSNTESDDFFGSNVAIDGDTIVVGAYGEDSNATGINANETNNDAANSGAVYIFTRSGTTWTQEAYIKASNTEAGDSFGSSVAIDGDTVVVGAEAEDSNATGVCNSSEVGGCNADTNGTNDGDGIPDDQEDNSAANSGAVYVFTRSGTTWTQEAYIKASNTEANDYFGSVDINENTIVVGAYLEDSNATGINGNETNNDAGSSGAIYVFTRSGTTWIQEAYIKASNTETNDYFGYNVAIDGNTIVVGAYRENSNVTGINGDQTNNDATDSGAIYVFTRSGTTWIQEAYIKASNTDAGDNFGSSVAIDGDTIVVGGNKEDSATTGINEDQTNDDATNSGAVYLFTRSGTTWTQEAYIKAPNTEDSDLFGTRIDIDENTILIGAHLEDSDATGINGNKTNNDAADSGAVYIY